MSFMLGYLSPPLSSSSPTSVVVSRQDESIRDQHHGRVLHARRAVLPHVKLVGPQVRTGHLVGQLGEGIELELGIG